MPATIGAMISAKIIARVPITAKYAMKQAVPTRIVSA